MKGVSDTFSRLQQEEGRTNVEIALLVFKEIFFPNPSEPTPPTQLRVFVAGLPRSGTGSMAVALEQLGYAPLHGPSITDVAPVLAEHYAGRASHEDLIRWQEDHGYDVQGLDQLGWKLYREAASIPNLKIVLTQHPRGAAAWAASWSSFVPDHIAYMSQPPFSFVESLRHVMDLQRDSLDYLGGTKDPRDPVFTFPAATLAEAYEKHNEAVVATVPADRLLVMDPTEGWEPLCEFLEIADCPLDTPYPHMTDRQMMMVISRVALVMTWIWPLLPLLVLYGMVQLVRACRKRSGSKAKAE